MIQFIPAIAESPQLKVEEAVPESRQVGDDQQVCGEEDCGLAV